MINEDNALLIIELLTLYKEFGYKNYLLEIQKLMNDNTKITDNDKYYNDFITTNRDTLFSFSKLSIDAWIALVYKIYHVQIE